MADSTFNPVFAAGVSAGSSLLGTVITNRYNERQADIQRDWNEQMMNKQNAFSLDMWNKTNEYNSPSSQVQRLRDAGLNPLFYGLDGSSANSFDSAQALGYDRSAMPNMINPISAGIDSALKVAQISNVQADTAKKGEETLTEVQRREKMLADIDLTKQELQNRLSDKALTDAQRASIEKGLEYADRLNEAIIAEKEAKSALDEATKNRILELLEGEKILQSKTIEDFEHKWNKISAEIDKLSKESGLLDKDIENYTLNHLNNGFMGSGLSLNNLLRALFNITPKLGEENNFGEGTEASDLVRSGQ